MQLEQLHTYTIISYCNSVNAKNQTQSWFIILILCCISCLITYFRERIKHNNLRLVNVHVPLFERLRLCFCSELRSAVYDCVQYMVHVNSSLGESSEAMKTIIRHISEDIKPRVTATKV